MTDPVSALVDEAKDFSERMTSQPWACELVERLATAISTLQGERDAAQAKALQQHGSAQTWLNAAIGWQRRAETAEAALAEAMKALEQRDDLLIKAEKLRFGPDLTVESRGLSRWAVCDGDQVLNASDEWEWEPQPSSRTDEFIARTRFTFADAVTRARSRMEPGK